VSDGDHYRQEAEKCRQQAARVIGPDDKGAWLMLAEDWLKLALLADQREGKAFLS
jgi:hypothetical protein